MNFHTISIPPFPTSGFLCGADSTHRRKHLGMYPLRMPSFTTSTHPSTSPLTTITQSHTRPLSSLPPLPQKSYISIARQPTPHTAGGPHPSAPTPYTPLRLYPSPPLPPKPPTPTPAPVPVTVLVLIPAPIPAPSPAPVIDPPPNWYVAQCPPPICLAGPVVVMRPASDVEGDDMECCRG